MAKILRIGVVGGGVIGRRHIAWLRQQPSCEIAGLADPSTEARAFCAADNMAWFADYRQLLDAHVDGVIIATPNALHLSMGLECLTREIPMLMEKPVADTVASAVEFTRAVASSSVPVLIGHYRRHSATVHTAREIVSSGVLGRIVTIDMRLMFLKPDDYFLPAWRSQPGAGPVMINFVHDIDALRFMCGEVQSVMACTSNAVRGAAVEDTAAIILKLASGALVTASLSDTAVSPYSWDLNAGEEPSFDANGKDAYLIAGTDGSLALPSLRMWAYDGEPGWMKPISERDRSVPQESPYVRQCRHFLDVVRGEAAPRVTAVDSTKSQMVADAILESSRRGLRIEMEERFAMLA